MKIQKIDLKNIEGFKLGNAENIDKGTGCTVVICEEGATGGVDVRGGAPATRETDLLRSENTVNSVHAVVLSGGSAFGLEAASGVMRELSERGIGFQMEAANIPIVCGASLYDLNTGDNKVFPDIEMGKEAVKNAFEGKFEHGNRGAGTGASVGKFCGIGRAMKTGLGTFACADDYVQVGAVVAVNAIGDIYNGAGNIIAGLRTEDGHSIYGSIKSLKPLVHDMSSDEAAEEDQTNKIRPSRENLAKSKDEIANAIKNAFIKKKVVDETITAGPATETVVEDAGDDIKSITDFYSSEDMMVTGRFNPVRSRFTYADDSLETYETKETMSDKTDESDIISNVDYDSNSDVTVDETNSDVLESQINVEDAYLATEDTATDTDNYASASASASPVVETDAAVLAHEESEPDTADENAIEDTEDAVEKTETMPSYGLYESEEEEFDDDDDLGYDIPFNTTISCLITNAKMSKSQANKLATILHDAYARAIKPVHSTLDGDTIFVLSTGKQEVNFDAFAALATDVLQYAIIDAATSAKSAYGLPAACDIIR